MKLLFKQRGFSWLGSFDIYNENNETVYDVEGMPSWGHKLEVYDVNGSHVATLKQRVFTFLPKFEIYIGNEYMGEIVKEFSLFKPKFSVNCNGWTVEGDFWQWDYQILSGETVVATIEKELLHLTDTYSIDVENPNDSLLALLVVLAIDAVKSNKSSAFSTAADLFP